ncbi:MAG: IS110 family transposase [Proteobacteria bacterium]|nr:IS110 family transposase [Pseudomonadota bacterium]
MKSKKEKCKQTNKKRQNLGIVHPNAAGIDVGSRKHYVAIPAKCGDETVRHFGCLTPELHDMAKWLKQNDVDTVAMESTGVYWIPVAQILEQYSIEVNLVDARAVKHVPGRKSDVQDSQWLQELHSFGLLRAAFRPTNEMVVLRSYWRHRKELIKAAATQIHLMQKSLELMNFQLHKVISDITGMTGMKILRAIISGERDPHILAQMRHHRIKCSEETIVQSLTGDWREEHLFTLQQALEGYDFYQSQVAVCDQRISRYMKTFPSKGPIDAPNKRGGRPRRKNQVHFDLRSELQRITGVDLATIDGIDVLTAQTVISESGFDMTRFPTEKNYSSWLGFSPNHVITGGKVRRRGTRKVKNRAAESLRVAAQSLHSSKTALGAYHRRMKGRLGPTKAITATAHKLAILVYRMLKFGMDYVDQGQEVYERQYKERLLHSLRKRARTMGYEMVALDSGEVVS